MKDSKANDIPRVGFLILTPEEARVRMGRISKRTMDKMRQDGTGPAFIRVGKRRIGYTEQALIEWAAARTAVSTAAKLGDAA